MRVSPLVFAAAVGLAGAPAAAHEGTLKLRPDGNPLQFVEWRPPAEGVLTARRDRTNRDLLVTATPGAKVSLPLGCPPKRHGNWEVETDSEPLRSDAGEFAYVRATSAPGSSGDGTFVITTTASQREGDAVEFDAACVRLGPGADDVEGTADDTVEQRETLRAKIVTVRHKALLAATHDETREHDHGGGAEEDEETGVPIILSAAGLVTRSIPTQDARLRAGALLGIYFDPLRGEARWQSFPFGVDGVYGRAPERLRASDGSTETHPAASFCGFGTGMWNPALAKGIGDSAIDLRASLGAGLGGCQLPGYPHNGEDVPSRSTPAAEIFGRLVLEGKTVGVILRSGVIISPEDAANFVIPIAAGLNYTF